MLSTVALTEARNHFALNKFAGAVDTYHKPGADFDREGSWEQRWGIYTILQSSAFGKEGELRIAREPAGNDIELAIHCRRRGVSGFSQYIDAEVVCATDRLATVRQWTAHYKLAESPDADPYLNTGMTKEGRTDPDGVVKVETGPDTQSYRAEGPVALKWGFLEAVARLTQEDLPVTDFTIVDEFDEVRPGQRLEFHEAVRVETGAGPERLTAFQQIGPGIIPTVYYVNEAGLTLFAVTGQEVYLLEQANGAAAEFETTVHLDKPVPLNQT